MLTTLSALPAEDTENHHHTTIKKRGGRMPLPWPQRIQQTAAQSAENPTGGESHDLFPWLQERVLIQEEGTPLLAKSSKISKIIITSEVLKQLNLKLVLQMKNTKNSR